MDMENSRQQLIDRLTDNYADYRAGLLLKDRQELIDGAGRIARTAEVFQYFTEQRLTEQELAYFLNFQNPLEVAVDHWESCELDTNALGAVIAGAADRQDDLTEYPLAGGAASGDLEKQNFVLIFRQYGEECLNEERTQEQKPSIKAQLAAKPIPGDRSATKPKERGER